MLQMSARLVSLLLRDVHSSSTRFRGFAVSASVQSYDMRRVEITPLEQRKLTFDTHRLVRDLEAHGFAKEQAETVVSALMSLSAVSLDTVYKDMVTQAQQEITLQQIMFHLDSIRKDMVILEKSEFANLRAENEKMKIELDQVKQQLMDSSTNSSLTEVNNKIDAEIAALKTLMESNKLETIRYLAASDLSSIALDRIAQTICCPVGDL
ncbi:hypothetical protein E2320_005589 [Naja naja]|nr:hypothetical protein E2320_005589 [Naja naja]